MPTTRGLCHPPGRAVRFELGAARVPPAGGHAGQGARARDDQPLLGGRHRADGRRARRPPAAAARDPARARARGLGRRRRRRRRARRPVAARRRARRARPGRDAASRARPSCCAPFAMYAGARRGRPLEIDPAHLRAGLEPALAHILEVAGASGALRVDTTPATVKRCYEQHAARVLRDHRLVAGYEPSGAPLTVVKAAREHRARQPRARLGPLRRRRAARQRRRSLLDAHRSRLRRAPRDAAAALADAALRRALRARTRRPAG